MTRTALVVTAVAASLSACSGFDTGRRSDDSRLDGGNDAGSAGAGGTGGASTGDASPADSGAPNSSAEDGGDAACVGSTCPVCSDGYCSPGEEFANCPFDCSCGNGMCDPFEGPSNCLEDCPPGPCEDGVQNGTESDVDCGGSCSPCSLGFACNSAADCSGPAICRGRCIHAACSTALDSIPQPGTGTFELPVHVVVGPKPVTPVTDAGVLAEGLTGDRVEAVTNASGDAMLTLDAARGPWMLTVAGFGAGPCVVDAGCERGRSGVPLHGRRRLSRSGGLRQSGGRTGAIGRAPSS